MTDDEENQLIYNMCLTWRHDFGLLPDDEMKALYNNMEEVYRHHIEPLLTKNNEDKKEIPKDIDRALFIGNFHCEENVQDIERLVAEEDNARLSYNMRKVLDKFRHDLKYLQDVCKKYSVET